MLGQTGIVYGAPMSTSGDPPSAGWSDINTAVMLYGVQQGTTGSEGSSAGAIPGDADMPVIVYGVPGQPETWPQGVLVQQRDEWWRTAAKVGIVSAAAYGIYKLVTGGR
jgi:hypothetical protein